jgi:hypothetical protein
LYDKSLAVVNEIDAIGNDAGSILNSLNNQNTAGLIYEGDINIFNEFLSVYKSSTVLWSSEIGIKNY